MSIFQFSSPALAQRRKSSIGAELLTSTNGNERVRSNRPQIDNPALSASPVIESKPERQNSCPSAHSESGSVVDRRALSSGDDCDHGVLLRLSQVRFADTARPFAVNERQQKMLQQRKLVNEDRIPPTPTRVSARSASHSLPPRQKSLPDGGNQRQKILIKQRSGERRTQQREVSADEGDDETNSSRSSQLLTTSVQQLLMRRSIDRSSESDSKSSRQVVKVHHYTDDPTIAWQMLKSRRPVRPVRPMHLDTPVKDDHGEWCTRTDERACSALRMHRVHTRR
jgi:hypothetical protein